ncbi:hypothetical protein AQJ66_08280 [Streptomyces bungoensis]|uniref:Uncharacterized protein n=1 Tax=Streptomyces bungoensis TaxID=285568 RepID=A0A101T840_9ACTN|nr:hypothetical protein [Streptomyces bungoensis]KUN87635.1 hypothetical protein AQJ66_08280 [Streptomyces bungoensis]
MRSSTGEAVVLLSGDSLRQVPQKTITDMMKAAAAVLSAAELTTVNNAVPILGTGHPDFHVRIEGDELTVYRLIVN